MKINTIKKVFVGNSLVSVFILSSLLSLLLIAFRIYYTSTITYLFLVWNLFLAWIPFLISVVISHKLKKAQTINFSIVGLFVSWLVFFPNAPYILTDLFHLKKKLFMPLWYDLVLLLSFAWNGLMLGFISLLKIQQELNNYFRVLISWMLVFFILALSSFSIYLGRFQRWNSWDIITNPLFLLYDCWDRIIHPFSHSRTWGVTILFSGFLIVGYLMFRSLIYSKEHLIERKKYIFCKKMFL